MEDRIIKARPVADGGAVSGAKYLKKDVFEAGMEARSIVEAARRKADAIVRDAEERRDALVAAACEEGFRDGLAQWDRALQTVGEAQESLDRKYEPEIVRMAVKIAGKIIGEELRSHPETIVAIARECLRGVRHDHALTLRVNAKELPEVERSVAALLDVAGVNRRLHITADPAVAEGGLIVDSVVGVIDARLETQLRCMEEILLRLAVRR
jgi:type III secretion protein L